MAENKGTRARRSTGETIAQLEARIARLKAVDAEKARKRDTRLKVIIGGAMIAEARENPEEHKRLVALLKSRVTREVDKSVVDEWLSIT